MTERMQGRIVNVWTTPAATTLKASAAIGATVLSVDDASIFNDDGDGGSLLIGTQVVAYTTVDDAAKTVAIAAGLTAAAAEDDPVTAWSELYGMVDDRQWAAVQPDGKGDRADDIDAIVDDGIELVDGDRGKRGEACEVVRKTGSDTWVLKEVFGRPRKARGMKAEAHDAYTLTATDVTAGVATFPLSHAPIDESVKLTFGTVPQEPTNYTVDYDAATITFPLQGWEPAGLRFSVHYWYVRGPVKGPIRCANLTVHDNPPVIGTAAVELINGFSSSYAWARHITAKITPAGTEADWTIYAILTPAMGHRGQGATLTTDLGTYGTDGSNAATGTDPPNDNVLDVQVQMSAHGATAASAPAPDQTIIGIGIFPVGTTNGFLGVTNYDACQFYWGRRIRSAANGEPIGPLGVAP